MNARVTKEHNLRLDVESGAVLDVRSACAFEELSSPFEVEIIARSRRPAAAGAYDPPKMGATVDLGKIVSKPAALRVTMDDGFDRVWSGVIAEAKQVRWDAGTSTESTYRLRLVANLWLLQERRGRRIFQHKKVPHIVKAILDEWKIEAEWKIDEGAYKEREYVVQYGETDLNFVNRLLEEEGISYYFINKGDSGSIFSQLVLNDAPHTTPRSISAPFVDNANTVQGTNYFTGTNLVHNVRPGLVTLGDYNFRNPHKPLFSKSEAAQGPEGTREIYEFMPGNFCIETGGPGQGPSDEKMADNKSTTRHDDEDYGKKRAQRFLEAERSDKRSVGFMTSIQGLRAGGVFAMTPHPHSELDGKDLLCVRSECSVDATGKWHVNGSAVFTDAPYRPKRLTPKPRIHGVQAAIVVAPKGDEEQIYTDEFGRVRVRFLWDRLGEFDDNSTCWLRVAQGWAGAQYGMLNMPRVGHELIVEFLDGDPDQPIATGRVYTVPSPAPYTLPKHKTKTSWQTDTTPNQPNTKSFNEILFDDEKDKELVYVQAQRNYMSLTKRHETERTGGDRKAIVGKHRLHVVRSDDTVHFGERFLVKMIEPKDLKILELKDPEYDEKKTFLELVRKRGSKKITLTTGGAHIELDGKDIRINAKGGIRFSADQELIIKGRKVYLNCKPAGRLTPQSQLKVDDEIKEPQGRVLNALLKLFSRDEAPTTRAQTETKRIAGVVQAPVDYGPASSPAPELDGDAPVAKVKANKKDGTPYDNIYIEGGPKFREAVQQDLDRLNGTPHGEALTQSLDQSLGQIQTMSPEEIDAAATEPFNGMDDDNPFKQAAVDDEKQRLTKRESDKKSVTITPGRPQADAIDQKAAMHPDYNGSGSGSGSKVSYNPAQSNMNPPGQDQPHLKFPEDDHPGAVPLGHELIHADRNAKGQSTSNPTPDELQVIGAQGHENDALSGPDGKSVTENSLRQQIYQGALKPRPGYDMQ